MNRGYTKRWRKRWDKGYHLDPLLFIMMDYFIDFANYEDREIAYVWKGKLIKMIKIKRGQHFFTVRGLTDFLRGPKNKLSRKKVRGRLSTMEQIGFLGIQSTPHYSIATVLNYNKYNSQPSYEGQTTNTSIDPTNEHQSTLQTPTPNKDKKGKKVKNKDMYVSILSHLNQKTGKNFKSDSKATQALIKARFNDGFKESDFICVIDNQCKKWITDPKMIEYLRPQTLFGTKFESYLNSCPPTQSPQDDKFAEYKRIMEL